MKLTQTGYMEQPESARDQIGFTEKIKFAYEKKYFIFLGILLTAVVLSLFTFRTKGIPNSVSLPEPTIELIKPYCTLNQIEYALEDALLHPEGVCSLRLSVQNDIALLASASSAFVNLQSIYFNENSATIPAQIADFENLSVLNFHHTINTSLPPSIGMLKKLTVLYMNKSDIELIPDEITELKNLNKLIITLNTKPVILPDEISILGNLNVLTLRGNPQILIPSKLPRNIEYLDLADNNLSDVPSAIFKLRRLKSLNISYNRIGSVSAEIEQLTNLQELRVNNNALNTFPSVDRFQNLKMLNLSNNKLVYLPEGIEKLQKLKYLNLKGNKIRQSEFTVLKQILPQTEIIY